MLLSHPTWFILFSILDITFGKKYLVHSMLKELFFFDIIGLDSWKNQQL